MTKIRLWLYKISWGQRLDYDYTRLVDDCTKQFMTGLVDDLTRLSDFPARERKKASIYYLKSYRKTEFCSRLTETYKII